MSRKNFKTPGSGASPESTPGKNGTFDGFPEACFEFLVALEQHNNREWFDGMRERCETQVFHPARSFVAALGLQLTKIHPRLVFDPSTNGSGSMFRLARDTRFSRDKSPYKTNLGFRFWLSPEARRAKRVGFYVHLDQSGVRVYGGAHRLMPDELAAFRDHVVVHRHGAVLRRILADLDKHGFQPVAERLVHVPRGYPADHPNADLLLVRSLFAMSPKIELSVARTSRLVGECVAHAAALKPLNDWFSEALPISSATAG